MPARRDFLFELGVEELPPKALRGLDESLRGGFQQGVEEAGLAFDGVESFATPRRLAVRVRKLAPRQPSRVVEKRGPPMAAARQSDGDWSRAARGFAESCGCRPEDLGTLATGKGEWLMYRRRQAGKTAATLLPGIAANALKRLPVGRAMRWGDGEEEFIRPVHWMVMLHGERVVRATLFGRRSGRFSRGHRFLGKARLRLESASDYDAMLRDEGRIIPGFAERRGAIERLAGEEAARLGGTLVSRPELFDEITGLVEWPVALTGRFEERFLSLPEEVIVASLQEHLRFFPVRDASGGLAPGFVLISNLESRNPAAVSAGAERVVQARLKDADFFFERDRSESLAGRVEGLAGVRYQQALGSLGDRTARLRKLAESLAGDAGVEPATAGRAALLCKADLLTGMVGEFPGLQGTMGGHYARLDGEPESVWMALREHYAPRHAGDAIPASPGGRALALADRLDMLAGLFAIGRRPSGASDPFGLRRAALAILRICIEGKVDLDLPARLGEALAVQPVTSREPEDLAEALYAFVMERLKAWYLDGLHPEAASVDVSAELFAAVRARSPASPLDFHRRLLALRAFLARPQAAALAAANKRIANILRSAGKSPTAGVDAERLREPQEQTLRASYLLLLPQYRQRLGDFDYAGALDLLAALEEPLADFFAGVMVMSKDPALRANRLALLAEIRDTLLQLADFSLLPRGSA